MYQFSAADGFVEITEGLGDMIKYVANEPSLGLYYIQQHAQHAVPNVINLKNTIMHCAHETTLHTEDLEDSITMVRSMKECGFSIVDEMISDVKRSLAVVSTRQPVRGLIQPPNSMFQIARTSSWASLRSPTVGQRDVEKMGSYLTGVLKSAKQKAESFKWTQTDLRESGGIRGEELPSHPDPRSSASVASTSSLQADEEGEELPLSSQIDIEDSTDVPSHGELLYPAHNFDEFKADREARLEEWLERSSSADKGTVGERPAT